MKEELVIGNLKRELASLGKKRAGLLAFAQDRGKMANLPGKAARLLWRQLAVMQDYAEVLGERITELEGRAKPSAKKEAHPADALEESLEKALKDFLGGFAGHPGSKEVERGSMAGRKGDAGKTPGEIPACACTTVSISWPSEGIVFTF